MSKPQQGKCWCIEKRSLFCCVRDCDRPARLCVPCHTWKGRTSCLQTGRTRTEMVNA